MLRLESKIQAERVLQTPHHENASDQQDYRERHLRGNQNIAERKMAKLFRRRFILNRSDQAGARGLQRGGQAEQQPGEERNGGGKQEHARVHHDVRNHWNVDGRTPDIHQIVEPARQQDSCRAARNGEEQALRQKLAQKLAAARAQSQADGGFFSTVRRASEQTGWQD